MLAKDIIKELEAIRQRVVVLRSKTSYAPWFLNILKAIEALIVGAIKAVKGVSTYR